MENTKLYTEKQMIEFAKKVAYETINREMMNKPMSFYFSIQDSIDEYADSFVLKMGGKSIIAHPAIETDTIQEVADQHDRDRLFFDGTNRNISS